MSHIFTYLPICELLSDTYLFPAMQILLAVFALFCLLISLIQSGSFARVIRDESSMGLFYGFYANSEFTIHRNIRDKPRFPRN